MHFMCMCHSMWFHPTHIHITTIAIKVQNCSLTTKELSHAPSLLSHLLLSCPLATTNLFSISIVLSFWGCCINGITQCITLWSGRCSLSIMPLRSSLVFRLPRVWPFLLQSSVELCGCTRLYLPIHLLKDIWVLSTFWLLWIELL